MTASDLSRPAGCRMSRRDLLRAGMGAAGLLAAGVSSSCALWTSPSRKRVPNLFTQDGQPLLVAVEGEDLASMLAAGLDALGGAAKLAVLGKDALLKPNLVLDRPYPITTSPDCIFEVAKQLTHAGIQRIGIYEAPGSRLFMPMRPERNFEKLGILEEARRRGLEVVASDLLARDEFCLVQNPDWSCRKPVGIHKRLHKASVVVSLPVLKRHASAGMTCALKNHFGSVMMADRLAAHRRMETAGREWFEHRLVEFADAVRPELTVVDARSILTRNGPTDGDVVTGVQRLLLSGDMVAMDAYCARLLAERDPTFSPEMIAGQLGYAASLGLGMDSLDKIRVIEVSG